MRPMLAETTTQIPPGAQWAHEVKWDGIRAIIEISAGVVTVRSRSGRDITAQFPEFAPLAGSYDDVVLDGEVVVLQSGRPSFEAAVKRFHASSPTRIATVASGAPATLILFDVLRLLTTDLTAQPWSARRGLLEQLDLAGPSWHVPPVYDDGEELFAATRDQGLEGIVSKRRTASYAPGQRSSDWLKKTHRRTDTVVVGGWRHEIGSTTRLGAVLVGLPDGRGGFAYAGRVGAGLAGSAGAQLAALLRPLTMADSPFSTTVPREDITGTTWVRPQTVIEVRARGRGSSGKLRQPAYFKVRVDLDAEELRGRGAAQ